MYRVIKAKGSSAHVVVENTYTKANIIIGRLSMEILDILNKAGYIEEHGWSFADELNLIVNRETAKKLSSIAMPMKKPIRNQRKNAIRKQENKKIDAMDVLLGLAQYN